MRRKSVGKKRNSYRSKEIHAATEHEEKGGANLPADSYFLRRNKKIDFFSSAYKPTAHETCRRYVMPSNEKINLEFFSLVWLDNMADATQENREIQDKFRSIINSLKLFDNCQQCEKYLREQTNEKQDKIIFIVSGRLGQEIIDKIHHLQQVTSIFVFCIDKERNELWANKYKKVRGVFVVLDDLLNQIELDRKSEVHKLTEPMEIFSDQDEILPILLRIDYSITDRRQLLDICSREYRENARELENIQDFEHFYSSSKAFKYFFDQTFLYRLLIKSLQLFNLDMLFLLRFFLQDLDEQLKSCPRVLVPVYRGQLMTDQQLELMRNSVNKTPLRFNSFIIAKKNREHVLKLLRKSADRTRFHSVLFQIEINSMGKQFEDFILFPITTQFRILSMEYQNNLYMIKIVVSNVNTTHSSTNPLKLSYRLKKLGRLDEAEQILYRLLSQYPRGNSRLYYELARIAQEKGLYEVSLQFYEKSLDRISSKLRPYCLNDIGCLYDYLDQYELALEFYSTSLILMKTDLDQAMCFNNIGITFAKQGEYQDAFQSFQQSLTIRQSLLSRNHLDIGISLANFAGLYLSTNQYDLALEYYRNALKIFSENHSSIYKAIVYQNLGQIFYEKTQLNEALDYYQQAANILRQTRSSHHPTLIYIEQIIKQLMRR